MTHSKCEFATLISQKAEKSLKFYKGVKDECAEDYGLFKAEFERLKILANEQKVAENVQLKDFCK